MWHVVYASGNLFSLFKTNKKYDSVTNLCLEKEKQVVKLSLSLSKLRSSFSLKILSACKENITNVC